MSGRRNNVEMQISEVEMLQSMFPEEKEIVLDDELIFIQMKNFSEGSGNDPNKTLKLKLNLTLQDAGCALQVHFTLPLNYPAEDNVTIIIRSQYMNKSQYSGVNEDVKEYVEEIGTGDLQIFQIIEWLNENGPNYVSQQKEDTTSAADVSTVGVSDSPQKFSRFWIYSHHIYSKEKRKNILEWSKELSLTGFSMPGKPGVVCVEGPLDNCEEFWQRMKRQTWKRLNLVHREDGVLAGADSENAFVTKFTDSVTEKDFGVHGGRDYHMDLGQFASFLTDHGSHDVFSILFGVSGRVKRDDV